jgi:hypothetical protein
MAKSPVSVLRGYDRATGLTSRRWTDDGDGIIVHAARVRAALSRSGAQFRIIDPAQKIPQRAGRMRNDEAEPAVCLAPGA